MDYQHGHSNGQRAVLSGVVHQSQRGVHHPHSVGSKRNETALDSLDIGTSRLITPHHVPRSTDVPTTTLVYAMVDSGRTTAEMNETQNLTSRTFTISPQRIYLPIVVR
ncbi:MAG: hypothetical protein IPL28_06130 [Chloroflexi bacterium]|nr:hypothetical protein [Chloroflexota bacterium]